jgi:RNA polymerase sigma-70 factor (ECF subfamily)
MATPEELSEFLAGVERRAFKQAQFAVRDEDAALDIVQEAMIKLATNYADRPAAELPLLFTRILQNATHDHFRRQKVRSTWVTLFSALTPGDDPDADPLETLEAMDGTPQAESATETRAAARGSQNALSKSISIRGAVYPGRCRRSGPHETRRNSRACR